MPVLVDAELVGGYEANIEKRKLRMVDESKRQASGCRIGELRRRKDQWRQLKEPTTLVDLKPLDEPAKKVRTKEKIAVGNECLARRGSHSYRNGGLKTVTCVIG